MDPNTSSPSAGSTRSRNLRNPENLRWNLENLRRNLENFRWNLENLGILFSLFMACSCFSGVSVC